MQHPPLDFSRLRCRSLFAAADAGDGPAFHERRRIGTGPDGEALELGLIADLLVIPALRLQIAPGGIVPQEVVTVPWTLDFEIGRSFQGASKAFCNPFDVVESGLEVCCLSNLYSRNFFHWITEELPRVLLLEEAGFTGSYLIRDLPDFAPQFLALLGVPEARILVGPDRPTRFRRAAFVSPFDSDSAIAHADVYLRLHERLRAAARLPAGGAPERIWMERGAGSNNHRPLGNPEEVHALIAHHGFVRIDMASLPVAEQIGLAAGARILAGAHGAAFAHALFQAPRSAVVECFSPLLVNPGMFGIYRILEHDYSMLVYDHAYQGYPHGTATMVNCTHLELVLHRLCGGRP